jgi:hypothetical protein
VEGLNRQLGGSYRSPTPNCGFLPGHPINWSSGYKARWENPDLAWLQKFIDDD